MAPRRNAHDLNRTPVKVSAGATASGDLLFRTTYYGHIIGRILELIIGRYSWSIRKISPGSGDRSSAANLPVVRRVPDVSTTVRTNNPSCPDRGFALVHENERSSSLI